MKIHILFTKDLLILRKRHIRCGSLSEVGKRAEAEGGKTIDRGAALRTRKKRHTKGKTWDAACSRRRTFWQNWEKSYWSNSKTFLRCTFRRCGTIISGARFLGPLQGPVFADIDMNIECGVKYKEPPYGPKKVCESRSGSGRLFCLNGSSFLQTKGKKYND